MTRNPSRKVNFFLAAIAFAASAQCCEGRNAALGVSEPSASAPIGSPTVTAISPNSAAAGGAAFTLTVRGTNFDAASTLNFGGMTYAISSANATQLTVVIPASAIAVSSTVGVSVTNPVTKATSNEVEFTIGAPIVAKDSGAFSPTGDMQRVRGTHMATLLPNGEVLIAGGSNGWTEDWIEAGQNDAELYNPAIGSFTTTAAMAYGRTRATATLLSSGKVLLTGGEGASIDDPPVLASAELYDPATSTFATAGSMANVRMGHTATLLPNGKVLIAGGGNSGGWGFPVFGDAIAEAELYDPSTNAFTPTGWMAEPRFAHTATLLPSGKVLIAGGFAYSAIDRFGVAAVVPLASTEIYDPSTGLFTLGSRMAEARGGHAATLLPDGTVLITGGLATLGGGNFYPPTPGSSVVLSSAELRDPTTGQFTSAGKMTAEREEHTATLWPNGKVLLAGGATGGAGTLRSAEFFDPATRSFVPTATMSTPRSGHSATVMPDGSVLITGGDGAGGRWDTGDPGFAGFLPSAEIYRPQGTASQSKRVGARSSPGPSLSKRRSPATLSIRPTG